MTANKTIGHIHVKVSEGLKNNFQSACHKRDMTESFVLKRLIQMWLSNKIKLEIE